MTTRNYYTSDETQGQANVMQCIPDGEDGYVIELDATLFHPQGGGQPSDGGTIDGVPVQRVFADGETVWHRTATPVAPGRSRFVSTVNYVIFMRAGIRPDI
jgi:Ser-tRNA(Ala) deacylase AlaX